MALFIPSESLARGLKDRFFDEALDGLEKSGFLETVEKFDLSDRSKWRKFIASARKSLGTYSLSDFEGGSKRQPYFVLNMIEIDKTRTFNQWEEKCLVGLQISVFSRQNDLKVSHGTYNIGEHAVHRLFMRSALEESNSGINFRSIAAQFSVIPFWANFWTALYNGTLPFDFSLAPEPQIPSKGGMFLCSFSETGMPLEVRTFVSEKQLTTVQELTRQSLYSVCLPYLQSPLTAYPSNWISGVDTSELTMALLARDLLKIQDKFLHGVIRRVADNRLREAMRADLLKRLTVAARLDIQDLEKIKLRYSLRDSSFRLFRQLTSGVLMKPVDLNY